MLSPSRLLDPQRLNALLGAHAPHFSLELVANCPSTNTLLLERAEAGAASGYLLVTDQQSAGRGSQGRTWFASPKASLTFSLLWRFRSGFERIAGLSLAVGVAIVKALRDCGIDNVGLKWPNDIVHQDAKLGGILIELSSDEAESDIAAIIGIGLNICPPENVVPYSAQALPPCALADLCATPPERHVLLASLLCHLDQTLCLFTQHGFVALQTAWQSYHAWQDRYVQVIRNGNVIAYGFCRGVDQDAMLLIENESGLHHLIAGDVSLRPARS